MAARIAGFVTREAAGLKKPRSISRNISPDDGGVALHYGGPAQNLATHSDCIKRWKGWQNFHMDSRGWSDIAYTGGVCNHGFAFAGRGAGVRTAANGTNYGNTNFYAICWLGGDGEHPSLEATQAYEWWVLELRKAGAGRRVRAHRSFKSTSCPGNTLTALAEALDNKDIFVPTTVFNEGGRMIIRFDGTNEVWEIVGSHLEYVTGDAFFARSLSHANVVVLEANHPLANLPRVGL